MASYVNTHGLLEQRRRAAKAAGTRGPRTFVSLPLQLSSVSRMTRHWAGLVARQGPSCLMADQALAVCDAACVQAFQGTRPWGAGSWSSQDPQARRCRGC